MSLRRGPCLETPRLVLRRWEDADRAPFAAMNADPVVMEMFPSTLTPQESDAFVAAIEAEFEVEGFGLWAVEVRATGAFAGFVGLHRVPPALPCAPAVEVGWRLATAHWGQGYATEAATAALAHGFDVTGLDGVVSFTAALNERSQRVMRRLGMTRDPAEDFDHPRLPPGHRLQRHVLYRRDAAGWRADHRSGGDG